MDLLEQWKIFYYKSYKARKQNPVIMRKRLIWTQVWIWYWSPSAIADTTHNGIAHDCSQVLLVCWANPGRYCNMSGQQHQGMKISRAVYAACEICSISSFLILSDTLDMLLSSGLEIHPKRPPINALASFFKLFILSRLTKFQERKSILN